MLAKINGWLDRLSPLGLLALRVVVGVIMVAHGFPKVENSQQLQAHVGFVHSLGFPAFMGYVSAFTELIGGALLILGLLTRFAAIAVAINMFVAFYYVHFSHGMKGPQGYEFSLLLMVSAFALVTLGPGPLALDRWLGGAGKRKKKA